MAAAVGVYNSDFEALRSRISIRCGYTLQAVIVTASAEEWDAFLQTLRAQFTPDEGDTAVSIPVIQLQASTRLDAALPSDTPWLPTEDELRAVPNGIVLP